MGLNGFLTVLKQRIKQHLLNASRRPRLSEDDDDTLGFGEDLEQV